MLRQSEKQAAMDYGYSVDSKKVQDALGYVDLEGICRSLSFAIMRHVDFAGGFLLLDDLREAENVDAQFSYKLTENLKIDLEEIRRKREADRE